MAKPAKVTFSWASTDQQQQPAQSPAATGHHTHHLYHSDSAPTPSLVHQPSCTAVQSVSSFSGAESMTDLFVGLLGRPGPSDPTRSPPAKSPCGSKVSSRRGSFMFFMGMSTDSAISDGHDDPPPTPGPGFRSSFIRKYSEKSTKQTASQQCSLGDEYNQLCQEHNKYKRIIDVVKGEYEESKNFEVFRRYTKLKGVIKRCVMYTKLGTLPDVSCALGMGGMMMMNTGVNRFQQNVASEVPKAELPERINLLKRRISLMRSQIETLSQNYEVSKQYIVFQRYRLMKAMIKELLLNCD